MPPTDKRLLAPHSRHIPASRVLNFVEPDTLDAALRLVIPDPDARRFIVRCIVNEGPIHHRGANFILISLLLRALDAAGLKPHRPAEGISVPMRLPPGLPASAKDCAYPITLPLDALRELAGGDQEATDAMVDCLTDGPPQHALANVIMVALLEQMTRTSR